MIVQQEMEDLFIGLGYTVEEGPEVEMDLYNLSVPTYQRITARDMQDTFYINAEELTAYTYDSHSDKTA